MIIWMHIELSPDQREKKAACTLPFCAIVELTTKAKECDMGNAASISGLQGSSHVLLLGLGTGPVKYGSKLRLSKDGRCG